MAKKTINIGTSANKGNGDPLRTAFDKINSNFNELYAASTLDPENTASNLVPATDNTYNLGSASKQWSDLHIKDFIYINAKSFYLIFINMLGFYFPFIAEPTC